MELDTAAIDVFVIKLTLSISLILFCAFYIWSHISDFREKRREGKAQSQTNRVRKTATNKAPRKKRKQAPTS